MTVIARLLTLVALVLMPFGMTAAPAHGGPIAHAVTADGCDGNEDQDEAPVTRSDCTISCTAIPLAGQSISRTFALPEAPQLVAPVVSFRGIVPEIATPPPRSAWQSTSSTF